MAWGKKDKQVMVELPWSFTSPEGMEVSAVKGESDGVYRLSLKGYAVNEHGKRVGWVSFKLDALKDLLANVGDIEDAVADFEVSIDRIKARETMERQYKAEMSELNASRKYIDDAKYAEFCTAIKAKYPELFPVKTTAKQITDETVTAEEIEQEQE